MMSTRISGQIKASRLDERIFSSGFRKGICTIIHVQSLALVCFKLFVFDLFLENMLHHVQDPGLPLGIMILHHFHHA